MNTVTDPNKTTDFVYGIASLARSALDRLPLLLTVVMLLASSLLQVWLILLSPPIMLLIWAGIVGVLYGFSLIDVLISLSLNSHTVYQSATGKGIAKKRGALLIYSFLPIGTTLLLLAVTIPTLKAIGRFLATDIHKGWK